MAKKIIKLTRDNIQYYLRDLSNWADENEFRNVGTVVNEADSVIEDLKNEILALEDKLEELSNRIVEEWNYPDLES